MRVGDRVGYARRWLQSVVGHNPTSELWHYRGTVIDSQPDGMDPDQFVRVQWDNGGLTTVASANIAVFGSFAYAHADSDGWIGYGGLGEKPKSCWAKYDENNRQRGTIMARKKSGQKTGKAPAKKKRPRKRSAAAELAEINAEIGEVFIKAARSKRGRPATLSGRRSQSVTFDADTLSIIDKYITQNEAVTSKRMSISAAVRMLVGKAAEILDY